MSLAAESALITDRSAPICVIRFAPPCVYQSTTSRGPPEAAEADGLLSCPSLVAAPLEHPTAATPRTTVTNAVPAYRTCRTLRRRTKGASQGASGSAAVLRDRDVTGE